MTLESRQQEFYESLEPNVREIVRYLRNCGCNTRMSCHHAMYVCFDYVHLQEGLMQVRNAVEYLSAMHQRHKIAIEIDDQERVIFLYLAADRGVLGVGEAKAKYPEGQKL